MSSMSAVGNSERGAVQSTSPSGTILPTRESTCSMPAVPSTTFKPRPAMRTARCLSSVAVQPMNTIRLAPTSFAASPRKLKAFSSAFSRTAHVLMMTIDASPRLSEGCCPPRLSASAIVALYNSLNWQPKVLIRNPAMSVIPLQECYRCAAPRGRIDVDHDGHQRRIALRNAWCVHDACLKTCLLYTSDAADDLLCVDLGGRRIIK